MTVVLWRGVVVVVDVRADAVQQRGVQRVDSFRAAEHARSRFAGVGTEGTQRDVHGRVRSSTDGTAHVVHDRAARLVANVGGDIFELVGNNV